jgi:hypothetical protein
MKILKNEEKTLNVNLSVCLSTGLRCGRTASRNLPCVAKILFGWIFKYCILGFMLLTSHIDKY